MKKNLLIIFLVSLVTFGGALSASASLLGSTIFLSHRFPDANTQIQSYPVLVQNGTGDTNIFGNLYTSNPEDDTIFINFFRPFTFDNDPFNGHVGEFIPVFDNISVDTNIQGWDNSRLASTNSSFQFNWAGLSVTNQSYFYATLNAKNNDNGQPSVPEPATMYLFGAGVGALLFPSARRKFSK